MSSKILLMKDIRIGESLWFTWEGNEYEPNSTSSYIYYTNGHIDLNEDVVRGALASLLQRDGISYSLGQGFSLVERAVINYLQAGFEDGEYHPTISDSDGNSIKNEIELIGLFDLTLVEIEN